MALQQSSQPASIIHAYLNWWSDAGLVDAVGDAPHRWLAPVVPAPKPPPQSQTSHNVAASTAASPQNTMASDTSEPPASGALSQQLEALDTLAQFDQWLHSHTVPGRAWSDHLVLPSGPDNAPVMILADVPDPDDCASGALFSGESGALLDAMLGAIGLERAALRIASVAFTRPIGGQIEGPEAAQLVAIARRHVVLANPRQLLLLGQQACLLMTGQPVPPDGKGQRQINHCGAIAAAFAAHHPRLLIARPQLKRPAWEALKRLKELS